MKVTNETSVRLLASLQSGFRTDCAHLEELEREMTLTQESAAQFGLRHGTAAWNTVWREQWAAMDAIVRRIRMLVSEMEISTRDTAACALDAAVQAWDKIQDEDVLLVEALRSIRTRAATVDGAVRRDWNGVAQGLEPQLAKLHTCARVLRIRVELLRSHSPEGVGSIVQQLLSKLPGHGPEEAVDAIPNVNLHEAAMELEHGKRTTGGLMDVVRGLLMWVETPAERAGEIHASKVTAATPAGALPVTP